MNIESKEAEKEIQIINSGNEREYSRVNSCGIAGINSYPVEIEVDISNGLPNFILVGLPDTAINESKERVRAAIKSSGFDFPSKKIVVNLAPADTKKAGPNYDLPIAIGTLSCLNSDFEIIKKENLNNLFFIGELGLSGKIRRVNGVLSAVILAKNLKAKGIIIPVENIEEASLIEGINIYPSEDLNQTINIINNIENTTPCRFKQKEVTENLDLNSLDFIDVKGQSLAKRAMEICAGGGHNILMIGSPGSGKSMLAERISTILLPLNHNEKIEVTQIYSSGGYLNKNQKLITKRPFRSPHHTISAAGLIGGGSIPNPGEISLAHKGVLFLDELTEFQRHVLDSLREAIEKKEITISRSRKSLNFPCDFTLVAACNPCPCGYLGDSIKKCTCSNTQIKKYLSKVSGPVFDRLDLQVEVKRLSKEDLIGKNIDENNSSKRLKERVTKARERQLFRYKNLKIKTNSEIEPRQIKDFCKLDHSSEEVMIGAIKSLGLTARSYDRVLKVSRTIADIEGTENIKDYHILEALQFRMKTLSAPNL